MNSKQSDGAISATELMAQLQEDEEYRRRQAALDAQLRERAEQLRAAERPIVERLVAAGFEIDSVWDLVNTTEPYLAALPILLHGLEEGGYPDRVAESLGRALAVKPAVAYWDRLKAVYLAPRTSGEENGAAVALRACATKAELGDLIGFLSNAERGESRIYFVRPIKRLGRERGKEALVLFRDDPVLGKEVAAVLGRRPQATR